MTNTTIHLLSTLNDLDRRAVAISLPHPQGLDEPQRTRLRQQFLREEAAPAIAELHAWLAEHGLGDHIVEPTANEPDAVVAALAETARAISLRPRDQQKEGEMAVDAVGAHASWAISATVDDMLTLGWTGTYIGGPFVALPTAYIQMADGHRVADSLNAHLGCLVHLCAWVEPVARLGLSAPEEVAQSGLASPNCLTHAWIAFHWARASGILESLWPQADGVLKHSMGAIPEMAGGNVTCSVDGPLH